MTDSVQNDLSTHVSLILLAGGIGSRMGAPIPKQYLEIGGKPIVLHSYELFCSIPAVREIAVVCSAEYRSLFNEITEKKLCFALPGKRRQDSVFNGLRALSADTKIVCIHDAARPLVSRDTIERVLDAASRYGAATAGLPLSFTVKQSDQENFVFCTLDRSTLWEIQTPQTIRKDLLLEGFSIANANGITVTDCSGLVELIPHPVKLVKGNSANLKITTPVDLAVAEVLLQQIAVLR